MDFYNDNDPAVCAWLEELIRRGCLPPGRVDQRSIMDLSPLDVAGFRRVHFFAGIGGWAHALTLAEWPDDRPVWTGSPPCQPFSVAGKGDGKDDARHLAPKLASLVGACRPGVLFGEQVASAAVFGKVAGGARKRAAGAPAWAWFDDLSDRLEAARYAVGAVDLPAAGVGAPHKRQRCFFGAVAAEWLAGAAGAGPLLGPQRRVRGGEEGAGPRHDEPERPRHACRLVDGLDPRLEGHSGDGHRGGEPGRVEPVPAGPVAAAGAIGGVAELHGHGREPGGEGRAAVGYGAAAEPDRGFGRVADRHGRHAGAGREQRSREHGQQQEDGRPGIGHNGPGPADSFWADADWLFCRDGLWRPVEPGTFPLDHGLPARVGRLRGYGNAIVPQAAVEFIRAFSAAAGLTLGGAGVTM